jgi:hypothetical protein
VSVLRHRAVVGASAAVRAVLQGALVLMGAKMIDLRVIPRHEADECVRRWHYSGKTYSKSTLHVGVFYEGRLMGAIQCGEGVCTPFMAHVVTGTTSDTYIEINRMALSDMLPRNAESRALSVLWRIIARERPLVEWVVSYSDATQCGDGAIYRAAGMLLTQCRRNTTLWRTPDGAVVSDVGIRTSEAMQRLYGERRREWRANGLAPLRGYQLRYIRFLSADARARYAGRVLPYDSIPSDARMVRGVSACAGEASSGHHPDGRSHRPARSIDPVPHQIRIEW